MSGRVTIINYNHNAHSIISAAGRISTIQGSADEIYDTSLQNEEEVNLKLINKILASGHESVLEHVFVNLSFDNVSVYVEQFMIEFRLASFTVKSRRYVDFGEMGYVKPDFSRYQAADKEQLETMYDEHMKYLFDGYNRFVAHGIPKEDARFVLPYSFKSNFYCTVNGRELKKIMNEMVYGRGKELPEIVSLGQSLFEQCEKILPYLVGVERLKEECNTVLSSEQAVLVAGEELVTVIHGSEYAEKVICQAALLEQGKLTLENEIADVSYQKSLIESILKCNRKRALEQANFTILFHKISLAGVTHLVRHRMQSIVIPEYLKVCNFDDFVLPESFVQNGLEDQYREYFKRTKEVAQILKEKGLVGKEQVYLLLSGMTIPIITTMNANELFIFMKLRTCNRAQWEIKACADRLLMLLREKNPLLFSLYGPSCYAMGKCPEGRMTCGKMQEVCDMYSME